MENIEVMVILFIRDYIHNNRGIHTHNTTDNDAVQIKIIG